MKDKKELMKEFEDLINDTDWPSGMNGEVEKKIEEIKNDIKNEKIKEKLEALPKEVEIKYVITSCNQCQFCKTERTPGAGYALDWFCEKNNDKQIAGYIEWSRDEPKRIPEWCPFRIGKGNK